MRLYTVSIGLGLVLSLGLPASGFAANENGSNAVQSSGDRSTIQAKPEADSAEEDVAIVVKTNGSSKTDADETSAEPKQEPGKTKSPTTRQICSVIADNADAVKMDRDFFARLIWKESRFDVGAVSPVGAQGIAQFMPYTAEERGLADPYNYEAAIRHSAHYLRDLKNELGNWGLAAAAYNGGINRMKRWIAGGAQGALPYETVDYVNAITYRPIEWFLETGRDVEKRPLDKELTFMDYIEKRFGSGRERDAAE